jgi:predicted enzyme related to lactoylglutathione lyase
VIKSFSHVMVYSTDIARSVTWYRDMLGFTEHFSAPGAYASLYHDRLKCRLDLHHAAKNDPNIGRGSIAYFQADDLDGTIAALKRKGVTLTAPRREGNSPRFCTLQDCDGNHLGLEEQGRH